MQDTVDLAKTPQLRFLLWNRKGVACLPAAEAFVLYEQERAWVDVGEMDPQERAIFDHLTQVYGKGVALV